MNFLHEYTNYVPSMHDPNLFLCCTIFILTSLTCIILLVYIKIQIRKKFLLNIYNIGTMGHLISSGVLDHLLEQFNIIYTI